MNIIIFERLSANKLTNDISNLSSKHAIRDIHYSIASTGGPIHYTALVEFE